MTVTIDNDAIGENSNSANVEELKVTDKGTALTAKLKLPLTVCPALSEIDTVNAVDGNVTVGPALLVSCPLLVLNTRPDGNNVPLFPVMLNVSGDSPPVAPTGVIGNPVVEF